MSVSWIRLLVDEWRALVFKFVSPETSASVSRRFGGTGLGLSISRQLTEAMQGTLDVSSKEWVGSTLHVELPVGQEEFTLLSPEEILDSLKQATILAQVSWDFPASRILVVDDGPENRKPGP